MIAWILGSIALCETALLVAVAVGLYRWAAICERDGYKKEQTAQRQWRSEK